MENNTNPATPPPDKDTKITAVEEASANREVALINENTTATGSTEEPCCSVLNVDTASHSLLATSSRKDSFEEEIMRPSSPNTIKYQEDIEDILNQDGSKVKTIKTFKEITGACPKINAREAVGRQVREMSETESSAGVLSFTDVKKETIIGEDGTKLVRTSQIARVRYNRPHYRNSASSLFVDTSPGYAATSSYAAAARALNYRSSSIAHSLSVSPVGNRSRLVSPPMTTRALIHQHERQHQYELMEQHRKQQCELHEQQRLQQQIHQQHQQHRQELIASINQRPPIFIPSMPSPSSSSLSSLLTFSSSCANQQHQQSSLNQRACDTRHYQTHQQHHHDMHRHYHHHHSHQLFQDYKQDEEDDRRHEQHHHHHQHIGHGSRNYYYHQQNPTDYVYNRGNRQYMYLSPPQYRSSSYGCASTLNRSRYSMPPTLGMSLSPPAAAAAAARHRSPIIRELVPPTFSYEIENVSVNKGGAACFKGTVNGSYPFETRWFVNDREVRAGERFEITTRQDYSETFLTGLIDYIISLRIFNCSYSDIGKYTVFVRNEAGDASCSAFLVFEGTFRNNGHHNKKKHVFTNAAENIIFVFFLLSLFIYVEKSKPMAPFSPRHHFKIKLK
jgi:hypothetical protein